MTHNQRNSSTGQADSLNTTRETDAQPTNNKIQTVQPSTVGGLLFWKVEARMVHNCRIFRLMSLVFLM